MRSDITRLWEAIEWTWFQKSGESVLYWHWSPNYGFEKNLPIRGWNECLITYVLAASSPTHPIDKAVYEAGWARNGGLKNGNTYYGYKLPLGADKGGPLFLSQYSFLGINPKGLKDQYADYWEQNQNHTLINYNYCKENPKGYAGYGASCWGLTASDGDNGYSAHPLGISALTIIIIDQSMVLILFPIISILIFQSFRINAQEGILR